MAGFEVALGGLEAKLKSPKSSLGILGAANGDFDVAAGFAVGFEVVSKKPPPLVVGEVSCGGATVERCGCLLGLVKLASGAAFCCCG